MSHDARLRALGLELPPAPTPVASYTTFVRTGNLVYTSGHGPIRADGTYVIGKLGQSLDVAQGQEAARLTGLGLLATLRANLGSLDRIERIVKVLGIVNATPEFGDHPQVIDGFSKLMVEVFGDAGIAARSAIGGSSLPRGIAVEIELVAQVS